MSELNVPEVRENKKGVRSEWTPVFEVEGVPPDAGYLRYQGGFLWRIRPVRLSDSEKARRKAERDRVRSAKRAERLAAKKAERAAFRAQGVAWRDAKKHQLDVVKRLRKAARRTLDPADVARLKDAEARLTDLRMSPPVRG